MTEETALIIAFISAGSALSGVILSQLICTLNNYLERRHRKNVVLQQKYEEVSSLLVSSLQWFPLLSSCKSTAEIAPLCHPTDAMKMYSLCLIYFPNLIELSGKFLNSLSSIYSSIIKNYNQNLTETAGSQAILNPNHENIVNESTKIRQELQKSYS